MWKAYFDKGLGLTNYLKYVIAFFGLASNDVKSTMLVALFYAIFCFILGWAWYRFKLIETEIEIHNNFDMFVREMRGNFGIPKNLNSRASSKRHGKRSSYT